MIDRINKLYNDVFFYAKKTNRDYYFFDDAPFLNLYSVIYEHLKTNDLFNEDIVVDCINDYLKNDIEKGSIVDDSGSILLSEIEKRLENNKSKQFVLIPLFGSKIVADAIIDKVCILSGEDDEIIDKIANHIGCDRWEIKSNLEHTKRSRAKNFLSYPIAVLQMENIDANITAKSSFLGSVILALIKLFAVVYREENILFEIRSILDRDNDTFIVVLNRNGNILSQRPLFGLIRCQYDLGFLIDTGIGALFAQMTKKLLFSDENDELRLRMLNALLMTSQSIEQYENRDYSLSLLLAFVALESLLLDRDNEKRLRLSVITSKIVSLEGYTARQIYDLINNLYEQRNDFVHAGRSVECNYSEDLVVLHKLIVKVLLLFVDEAKWLLSTDEPYNQWRKYIDNTFRDALTSSL